MFGKEIEKVVSGVFRAAILDIINESIPPLRYDATGTSERRRSFVADVMDCLTNSVAF